MTITKRGTEFEDPVLLRELKPPYSSGVYIVLKKSGKGPGKIIYIGESGHLSKRGFPDDHEKYPCWKKEASSDDKIYIAIHSMIGKSADERVAKETELINAGKGIPICNKKS